MNLVVNPIITGLAMSWIGSERGRRGKKITRIESFNYRFAFAFGVALVRNFFVI